MAVRFDALGIIVDDMPASLAFYRLLGLDIPAEADGEAHVECALPSGIRIMWDTAEVVRSFSNWQPPTGGHRVGLAFLCDLAEDVDAMHSKLPAGGASRTPAPHGPPPAGGPGVGWAFLGAGAEDVDAIPSNPAAAGYRSPGPPFAAGRSEF